MEEVSAVYIIIIIGSSVHNCTGATLKGTMAMQNGMWGNEQKLKQRLCERKVLKDDV